MPKIVHMARHAHVEDPESFQTTITLCAPTGTITGAGWDRHYAATNDIDKTTCKKCLKEHGILAELAKEKS